MKTPIDYETIEIRFTEKWHGAIKFQGPRRVFYGE